jgi:hypothetical protein
MSLQQTYDNLQLLKRNLLNNLTEQDIKEFKIDLFRHLVNTYSKGEFSSVQNYLISLKQSSHGFIYPEVTTDNLNHFVSACIDNFLVQSKATPSAEEEKLIKSFIQDVWKKFPESKKYSSAIVANAASKDVNEGKVKMFFVYPFYKFLFLCDKNSISIKKANDIIFDKSLSTNEMKLFDYHLFLAVFLNVLRLVDCLPTFSKNKSFDKNVLNSSLAFEYSVV